MITGHIFHHQAVSTATVHFNLVASYILKLLNKFFTQLYQSNNGSSKKHTCNGYDERFSSSGIEPTLGSLGENSDVLCYFHHRHA